MNNLRRQQKKTGLKMKLGENTHSMEVSKKKKKIVNENHQLIYELVTSKNDLKHVYQIIYKTGLFMYEKLGLSHWYPLLDFPAFCHNLQDRKIYLVTFNDQYVATFSLGLKETCYTKPIWNNTENAFIITNLAVVPPFHGYGFGSQCLNFVKQLSIQENKVMILLDTVITYEELHDFYTKNGFKKVGSVNVTSHKTVSPQKYIVNKYKHLISY